MTDSKHQNQDHDKSLDDMSEEDRAAYLAGAKAGAEFLEKRKKRKKKDPFAARGNFFNRLLGRGEFAQTRSERRDAWRESMRHVDRRDFTDRFVPPAIRPYVRLMRADKPIGTWLLFWPCVWGISMGTWTGGPLVDGGTLFSDVGGRLFPDPILMGLFLIGAFVMRGAGCVINDIWDRDIDGRVERTKTRPIPAGEISVAEALIFMGVLCLIGLMVLIQLRPFAMLVGVLSLLPVALYPLAKRVTNWPQVVLGLTINWGALLGYAAVTGTLQPVAFVIYAAGVLWTLGYDTIYAHQDKEDDMLVGVKSSALALGDKTRPALIGFYGGMGILLIIAGVMAGMGPLYYGLLVLAGFHGYWQIATVDINDPELCLKVFKSNRDFGFFISFAIVLGMAYRLG